MQLNLFRNINKKIHWICFIIIFVIYFLTCCRTVPPYRDSGELIVAAHTLSVAHSPGYPLYMIAGKIFIAAGAIFGINPAWSLNLFSVFCGAFTVLFLYLVIYKITLRKSAAFFGSLLAGLSYINWYLSIVAEMYALSLLLVVVLLYMLLKRKILLFFFISGLMLGNHLTSLFAFFPMAGYILFSEDKIKLKSGNFILFFIIGLGVYTYLPVRASADSFINWGDPSNLVRFFRVISRHSYGHTLDLVSREVTLGQVLIPNLLNLGKSILRDITLPGIILAVIGAAVFIKRQRNLILMLTVIFLLTGPYFLYLARMPVNPHAAAITEVGYMIPETVLAVFAALGIAAILNKISLKRNYTAVLCLAFALLIINAYRTYGIVDKSSNYIAEDYAVNILNSMPEGSFVIMRKDHTMFALWYKQFSENYRTDVKVISKGLLSAEWYRKKLQKDYPRIKWKKEFLNDTDYILSICNNSNYSVFLSPAAAAELDKNFYAIFKIKAWGLVDKVAEKDFTYMPDKVYESAIREYKWRNELVAQKYYDFFSGDFISAYAAFYNRLGLEYMSLRQFEKAEKMFLKASSVNPVFPEPASNLAYIYFASGKTDAAIEGYKKAVKLLKMKISKYTRKSYFQENMAELYNNLGAAYEKRLRKQGNIIDFENALQSYSAAIKIKPDYAQAYYNRGVLYWNSGSWEKVIDNLNTALHYDPENNQIKKFLSIAIDNLRQKK